MYAAVLISRHLVQLWCCGFLSVPFKEPEWPWWGKNNLGNGQFCLVFSFQSGRWFLSPKQQRTSQGTAVSPVSRVSLRTQLQDGRFPRWHFLLRDSLALQYKEKIILSLCVVVTVCVCVCWQVAQRGTVCLSGLTDSLSAYELYISFYVLLLNKDKGCMNVSAAAAWGIFKHIPYS